MSGIPEATAIILTTAERSELEGLVRSTKTEHRLRQRARIVLFAAEGMASRAIGRAVGCTTGPAPKWRVRYAEKRFDGLDETGDRGAEPKYTARLLPHARRNSRSSLKNRKKMPLKFLTSRWLLFYLPSGVRTPPQMSRT